MTTSDQNSMDEGLFNTGPDVPPGETPPEQHDTEQGRTEPASPDAAPPAAEAAAETAAPAPRKRARRATRKAAAVAQAVPSATPVNQDGPDASAPTGATSDDVQTSEAAARGEAPSAEVAPVAPVKKAARKRAPRKKATAAATSTSSEPAAPTAEVSDGPEADAAESEAVESATVSSEAVALPELVGTGFVEEEADPAATEGDEEAAAAPAVPSFSVLFQPPELPAAAPTRRTRRRAEPVPEEQAPDDRAPAGPGPGDGPSDGPDDGSAAAHDRDADRDADRDTDHRDRHHHRHHHRDADHRDTDDRDADHRDRDAAEPGDDVPDGAPENGPSTDDGADGDSTPRRSRRRRGGKGRRGRSAADGEGTDDEGSSSPDDGSSDHDSGLGSSAGSSAGSSNTDHDVAAGSGASGADEHPDSHEDESGADDESSPSRRRRRRRRGGSSESGDEGSSGSSGSTSSTGSSGSTGSTGSSRSRSSRGHSDEPTAVRGSTRLEAKKQRRREGREAGRRRTVITEAEFLARREAVDRVMVVRNKEGRTQMGVLEDGVLVEHYIDQATNVSMAGNIYLGRVQNVLPSMEAAFVDIGKGRNAVLYAGEVNWDAAGLESNQPRRIEHALSSGLPVLVQVTKDPIGHKGARLTSQISLPGRYLVYIPNSQMTGISRKLPEGERARLKKILREVVPSGGGVIVRTAAEGASEAEIRADVERLSATWEDIQARSEAASGPKAGKSKGRKSNGGTGSSTSGSAPMLLHGEPDLTVRVIRDVFNEDFKELVVSGEQAWQEIHPYITSVAPDLADRVTKWTGTQDLFTHHRVDEQIAKAMDRKVWLPSGGSLVIDRTEAMTVVDVNTGKFIGSGGNLEETVTKNNIEAAEEIVRQLRLRDIGGIIVVDFIDMVLEANRELVVRRLLECLGRDRTKHQVAEVTSLGLVQMTRKRVGSGLIEVFSETCEHCNGRGFVIHSDPVDRGAEQGSGSQPDTSSGSGSGSRSRRGRRGSDSGGSSGSDDRTATASATPPVEAGRAPLGPTAARIAAAAHAAALKSPAGVSPSETSGVETSAPETSTAENVVTEPTPEQDSAPAGRGVVAAPAAAEPAATAEPDAEVESGVPDASPAPVAEVALVPEEAAPTPEDQAPVARPRRRRGRVMAPAGPPTHVDAPVELSAEPSGEASPETQ